MEVMGRYVGWIALHSGLAGRADAILIPEIASAIDKVAAHLRRKHREGKSMKKGKSRDEFWLVLGILNVLAMVYPTSV